MCSVLAKTYLLYSSACRYFQQMIRSHALRRISSIEKQQQVANVVTTKQGTQFILRSVTIADIPQVMDIRRRMGGIEVESCLRSWITLDPGCIKIAVTHNDEIIGTCSDAKNGDDEDGLYFGGLFYTKPEYQKLGIGQALFRSCVKHAGSRNIGLNAVPGSFGMYTEGGFPVHDDSFTTVEYRITSSQFTSSLSNIPPPGINICPFDPIFLSAIFAYDYGLIGFHRTNALAYNLMEAGSRTLVAFKSDGTCAGFGTAKITCTGAVRVGPLYANGPEVAEVLFRRLVDMMNAEVAGFVFVTTSGNLHVKKWMDRSGVVAWKICDRLYSREKQDNVDHEKMFALFDVNFAPF